MSGLSPTRPGCLKRHPLVDVPAGYARVHVCVFVLSQDESI